MAAPNAKLAAQAFTRLAQISLTGGILAFTANECIYTVDAGERVVMFDRFQGVKPLPVGEGAHFKIPFIQEPFYYNIRATPSVVKTSTGTKDIQTVDIALRILSRPHVDDLPKIHNEVGTDYQKKILPSIVNEVLKAVVAKYNPDQLLTLRSQVSAQIREGLERRAEDFSILLDDVSITELTFGRDFTNAVEQKQVALQEAERSKFVVDKAEQERKVAVIEAEGEAEGATIISKALKENGRGLIEVRKIDAAKEIAEKLSRSGRVTYLPSGNNMLLNVDK
eukprot:maker-scaffold_8-snap-gene-12.53-mRNA-1 protein AED:0.31 eAED:0.31 QI:120/1/1/1/0.5/0.33/3/419/279